MVGRLSLLLLLLLLLLPRWRRLLLRGLVLRHASELCRCGQCRARRLHSLWRLRLEVSSMPNDSEARVDWLELRQGRVRRLQVLEGCGTRQSGEPERAAQKGACMGHAPPPPVPLSMHAALWRIMVALCRSDASLGRPWVAR